jgi:hypothetical protein
MKNANVNFSLTDYREQKTHDQSKLLEVMIKGGVKRSVAEKQAAECIANEYLVKYESLKQAEQKLSALCSALDNSTPGGANDDLMSKEDQMRAFILSFEPDPAKAARILANEFSRLNSDGGNAINHKQIEKQLNNLITQGGPENALDMFLFTFYRDRVRYLYLVDALKNTVRLFLERYIMTVIVHN